MPVITLKQLKKNYNSVEVIHEIDLVMEDNEFTVFVGPSGCGKSTTLRMIAGLEDITSGQILMGDKDISNLEPIDRNISMVFQDYALYPHMNVEKNMSFALRLAKYDKAEIKRRITDVAKMLGLTEFLHRKPAELSGGQRQRVAMGRALVRDSGTLLMDEPLSNLDAKLRGQMRAELAIMSSKIDKNIIYVTHDQIEAMTLADRIVVMKDGYIQQHGSPEDLYERPSNKFVAGFMGMPPMNFLQTTLFRDNGDLYAEYDGSRIKLPAIKDHDKLPTSGKVIIGFRPSALKLAEEGQTQNILNFTIKVSEYIGNQTVLTSEAQGNNIMAEVESNQTYKVGQDLKFFIQPDDLYLFDESTELAIY
jgi:multiple sugar transport system ATP-binding protein